MLGAWSLSHWTTRQVPQKQKFIFLLFLRGRTFRDHFDQMRKLGLSLNLVKLLDLSKPHLPHVQNGEHNSNELSREDKRFKGDKTRKALSTATAI